MNPEIPDVVCQCTGMDACVCPREERFLRAVMGGKEKMPTEFREWALKEIDSVEGHSRGDYDKSDDADVARGVLSAWMDYCRDKGLL